MGGSGSRSFDDPDEVREMDKGKFDVLRFGGTTIGRGSLEPGWRWSEIVKPIVGGDSCQQHHVGYCLSGRLHVEPGDGEAFEVGQGQAYSIEPGHDAWVEGDETYEALEFSQEAAETYGKQ
jgi:hypothetical protein